MGVGGRLLLLSPSLGFGGMELQLIELARAAGREGRRATIAAGDGPLATAARAVADVELMDWTQPRAVTARRVLSLAGDDPVSVMQADPHLLHLIAPLAAAGTLHLCLHNRPETFETWFNPHALDRFRRFVPALHASGRVTFTASSREYAHLHAQQLGLPEGAVSAWFPGLDVPPGRDTVHTGPLRRVAVVCRLSPEKLRIVGAAVELVAAALDAGADARLDVHGDGPAAPEAERLLATRLPAERYRLLGETSDPLGAISDADVVVNGGRAAIEGLLSGCRVVVPYMRLDQPSAVGPPVLPSTFGELKELNFVWREEPCDPRDSLRRLEAMSAADVTAVRDAARRELSAQAVLEGHRAAIARTDPGRPPGRALLDGVIEQSLELEDARAEAQEVADQLWAELQSRAPAEPG